MRRILALVVLVFAAMFALSGCAADSSAGVKVVGDNIANLPAGDTMVVYKPGKYTYSYTITFDGESTVKFVPDGLFMSDGTITVAAVGQPVAYEVDDLFMADFIVTKRDDRSVDVQWPSGLTINLSR